MITIGQANRMPRSEFISEFGGIYESSSWVAEAVCSGRPFESIEKLKSSMKQTVEVATLTRQLELIRAHPDLAGKLARSGELTIDSEREQSRLGLDRLSDDEFEKFDSMNRSYRERFDIPFIICVGLVDKAGIISAFQKRLTNDIEEEYREALRQIHLIAELRLEKKFS